MKTLPVFLFLLGIISHASAQSENEHIRNFQVGFNAGMNYSLLMAKDPPLPNQAVIVNDMGYQVGIAAAFRVSNKLAIHPRAELVLNNGIVQHGDGSGIQDIHEVMPVGLNLMAYTAYEFGRGRHRPYILIGPDVKLPYLQKSRSSYVFSTSANLAVDAGAGIKFPMKQYTLSPEIRYSFGLTQNTTPLLTPFYFHSVSLVLNVL